ncbi:MAG: hypothetical protein E6Q97_23650 [Desulfurellales bacterium]|nr:MAG: hypothetical protein E6Q97_23650 [Desulfurellales bacterium]
MEYIVLGVPDEIYEGEISEEQKVVQQHFTNISRGMRRDLLKALFQNIPIAYDALYIGLYVNTQVTGKLYLPSPIPTLEDEYPGYITHNFTWPTPIITTKKLMTSEDWEIREDRLGNTVAFNKDQLVFGDEDNPFGSVTEVHGALISTDPSGIDIIMSVPFDAPTYPTVAPGVALMIPRAAILVRFDSANPEKWSYVAEDYTDTVNVEDWYG